MHFYFNLAGAVHDPDDEGYDLPTVSEARIMAVKLASEMLRDRPKLAWLGDEFRVEVTDDKQQLMFTIVTLGVDATGGGTE